MEMEFNADFLQYHTMSEFNQDFDVDTFLGNDCLDALMPGSDVNLASLIDQDKFCDLPVIKSDTYPSKSKSPWHESDSGVSDSMSFVGSPVDPGVMNGDGMIPADGNHADTFDDLAAYLMSDTNKSDVHATNHQDTADSRVNLSSSGRPIRKCAQNRKKVEIKIDDSDSDDDMPTAVAKKAVPNQPLNYFQQAPAFTPRNDIKIVKVMKPQACGGDVSTDEIMKVLEEKSKKNAQQAKLNREKKKVYIKSLEDENESLKKNNKKLMGQMDEMQTEKMRLEDEVEYLKSVLANASALSGLLKNISNVKEVKLSATITGRKRAAEDDHSYNLVENVPQKRARLVKENLKKAGVCLHVSDGEACLEFCAHCSTLAQKSHGRRGTS